ncbi:MAG: hypothetical protein LBC97_05545 [Bifidobacteriaceae bacterium]|nr:hypothetical protein [Bifidobacteriaceae bacterium]
MNKVLLSAGLAAALTLVLTGCGDSNDVASLNGGGPKNTEAASPEEEQARAADAMAECLQKAGIPAKATSWDGMKGQKQLELDTDQTYALAYADGSGASSAGGANTEAEWDAFYAHIDELAAEYRPSEEELEAYYAAVEQAEADGKDIASIPEPEYQPYLFIGNVDHSAAFAECLKQSGYTEPVYQNDPVDEVKQKEAMLEATTGWIKCARDNGFPDLKDPAPAKADDWETQPMAVLPGDITVPELEALLVKCPNFDSESFDRLIDAMIKLGPDASEEDQQKLVEEMYSDYTDPSIGFDLPGWNGQPYTFEGEGEDPDYAKGQALSEVLYQEQTQFWEEAQKRLEEAGFTNLG